MKTALLEVFRCDANFKSELAECAQLVGLDRSSYIRWVIRSANRKIKGHGTGVKPL